VPVETEFGRKRAIDQSSCNKDFSCLKGFCPSFVTLEGAQVRKAATAEVTLPDLPAPVLPAIDGTYNVIITGVGGTGVVTVGAVLAMAAHVDGKGAGMMEMAGLAQKGGAVHIHLRLAEKPQDISAIRVAVGEADCVIGGDLVVTGGAKTIGLMRAGRTGAVVNAHEIITGDFTRNRDFHLPADRLRLALEARLKDRVQFFDATDLARRYLGDSIYANMVVLGAAWQMGLIPLSEDAILRAVALNGASVDGNKKAFAIGRWAAVHPDEAAATDEDVTVKTLTLKEKIDVRAAFLVTYQNAALADRYRALVDRAPQEARAEVAEGYFKLLAYKDEYEVARLHLQTADKARAEFDGAFRMSFHLAPPILARKGSDGRPKKMRFGPWVLGAFRLLARMKGLRGTSLDPFGYGTERRAERALIAAYEADMGEVLPLVTPETADAVRALALLPLEILGFGPVKAAAMEKAAQRRAELLAVIRAGGTRTKEAAE
jgi:indolepyruvate ferredoxin oxidoreductase